MKNEYRKIFNANSGENIIKNGKPLVVSFQNDENSEPYRLMFKGETTLFYMWKSEPDCRGQYVSIEDGLNKENAVTDRFCLDFSSEETVKYRKTVYKKTDWMPVLSYLPADGYYTENWNWGIYATARNLKISEGGFVRFSIEVFYKDNASEGFVLVPDEKYTLEIPEGDFEFEKFSSDIVIDGEKTSYVAFLLQAEGYSGELYFEHPFLTGENLPNMLPDFSTIMPNHENFSWIGINISKKEWPVFKISLNGKAFFEGELFEPCHRFSEFEVNIPRGLVKEGENTLSIETGEGYDIPVNIKEAGLFYRENSKVSVIACPSIISIYEKPAMLIKTAEDNMTVELCGGDFIKAEPQSFKKAGLHFLEFMAEREAVNVNFEIKSVDCVSKGKIDIINDKQPDGILLGSGDMIYINHEKEEDVDNFLSWYIANEVGNMVTIRNVYRWGGGRRLDEKIWAKFKKMMEEGNIKYAHMVDGRDLPGAYCNPSTKMLEGKNFLGRQGHEYDGAFGYWGARCFDAAPLLKATVELWSRVSGENFDIAEHRQNFSSIINVGGSTYNYQPPNSTDDMEEAAKRFIDRIRFMKTDSVRHTGPTVMFKYFHQAGYDFTGAELMYSSFEVLSAALRGANYCYGKKTFGAHLAVQWSTTPHDDELRYRRFRLALYLSYMLGYSEINTEEGLWHLEEYYQSFGRTDEACLSHARQQRDLYNYIRLNGRKGEFVAPFAFVQGRYDGWNSFVKYIWGQSSFNYSPAEKSWDLLKEFYPRSFAQSCIYCHPCPAEPVGYYTGTPYGNADIVPIETSADKLGKYGVLCFAGYNKFEDEDAQKLISYMQGGGTVIIGWAHLSHTTNRKAVENGELEFNQNAFTDLICSDINAFETVSVQGGKLKINKALRLENCEVAMGDEKLPLVIKKNVGSGTLWFVNAAEYPGEETLMPIYKSVVDLCRDSIVSREKVFVNCDENVQFSMYKHENSYDIYLLAINWWSGEDREAGLRINGSEYTVNVPFGTMVKIVVNGDTAAWIESENAVVTGINGDEITVCGSGKQVVFAAKNGKITKYETEFTDTSVMSIKAR